MTRVPSRTARILEFIHTQNTANGIPPSLKEIADHEGIRSLGSVHWLLSRLERASLIEKRPGYRARSITLPGPPLTWSARPASARSDTTL